PDHLIAPGADTDKDDRHADEVGEEAKVVARVLRQLRLTAAVADVLRPSRQLEVLGLDVMQDRLVVGERVERRALGPAVPGADLDRAEAAEDVELGDDQAGERVQSRRVAERDKVHPSGSPGPAGGRPELPATLTHLLADL